MDASRNAQPIGGLVLLAFALLALAVPVAGAEAGSMPGTLPIEIPREEIPARMMAGMDRFLTGRLAGSPSRRSALGPLKDSSRTRLRERIGASDQRLPAAALLEDEPLATAVPEFGVRRVRWPVFDGLTGEGLLLEPRTRPVAAVIAIPDAGWTPEALAGLERGIPRVAQFARRLAESGCLVLVPAVIGRTRAGVIGARPRDAVSQSRREVVHRMAFQLGRHVVGLEVQKVLAGVDWFGQSSFGLPVGVAGYGEGGLLALYSAALDTRIRSALVSGYFGPREQVWREPLYRNIWKVLEEFGDAEVAGLIAPRRLVVEPSRGPEVGTNAGGDTEGAAPGFLSGPLLGDVLSEFDRARKAYRRLGASANLVLAMSETGRDEPGSSVALGAFLQALGSRLTEASNRGTTPAGTASDLRQQAQFQEMVSYCQKLLARSGGERERYWSRAAVTSAAAWERAAAGYRRELWEGIFGKLAVPPAPWAARTRRSYTRPHWNGHEVQLPVLPGVFAYGQLLVPHGIRPGERRPVVVTQHGRAGRPDDLIDPQSAVQEKVYKRLAAQLVELGFVVYAPQNPYIFEEQYRFLQRKANPLGLSLFSFILAQHERTLEWLGSLPFVDPARIGFYGLSYGGKTAMRVPPLLEGYALSICSADFNEYSGKMIGLSRPDSFLWTGEHEMYEFNLANRFNYSDLARLIAPRPFMVERGHGDGVASDNFVEAEFQLVHRFYARLGVPDRARIEFFEGGHEINAKGTFEFLARFLAWPPARM